MIRLPIQFVAAFVGLVLCSSIASAQCQPQWLYGPDQGVRGVNGTVYAMAEIPSPVAPAAPPVLVAGGSFTVAGHKPASSLAYWDGTWHAFGAGVSGVVYAMTLFQGDLIVAGSFSTVDGLPIRSIARWNGSTWLSLGTGVSGTVLSLHVWDGKLYVGGTFSSAGGVSANNIAVWDGVSWSALGPGLTSPSATTEVRALAAYQGKLIAGGQFSRSGSRVVSSFASWNGSEWQQEVSGIGNLRALRVYGGKLYAGGDSSSGTSVGIRAWNGVSWENLGSGVSDSAGNPAVYALGEHQGQLVVGGNFYFAGGRPVDSTATWNGTAWGRLGTGFGGTEQIRSLATFGSKIVAGGSDRDSLGGVVRQWDGAAWQRVGVGFYNYDPTPGVLAMHSFGQGVVMGGVFAAAGNVLARGVVQKQRDGTWRAFGVGLGTPVNALAEYSSQLVAAGAFIFPGSSSFTNIVTWNGSAWTSLGDGPDGTVRTLSVYAGELIAGGDFGRIGTAVVNRLARWNGNAWLPLGNGANGSVLAAATYRDELIVAGGFSTVDGVAAAKIARWDGTRWATLGTGITSAGFVRALCVHRGRLIAAGSFTSAGNKAASQIATWDGQQWLPMGSGLSGGDVNALVSHQGSLFAAGGFTTSGSRSTAGIARWDGTQWQPVGTGVPAAGYSLLSTETELLIGGYFKVANGLPSYAWARFGGCAWCPADLTADRVVDDRDFQVFVRAYSVRDCVHPSMPAGCPADLTLDGYVDDDDFLRFAVSYDEMICP